MNKYLCIDVGGSSIKYALITKDLQFSNKGSIKTPMDNLDNFIEAIGSI